MPLNPNGKIDRFALPAPVAPTSAPESDAAAAADPAIQALLAIVRELVPGVAIAAGDDLVAKGLHSIAMMRLVALCKERLGVTIRVRDVFRLATVDAIANAIREAGA
ncbi:phosphopantetheine-binding protein [Pseudoduganella armeniaca]|nr:phosphopantetheine-binding protein [Pseudoduganella armeniaca]